MPFDGVWLRAPCLHNGSAASLRELLRLSDQNLKSYISDTAFTIRPTLVLRAMSKNIDNRREFFELDTSEPGNGKQGHEGEQYGTELPGGQKERLD